MNRTRNARDYLNSNFQIFSVIGIHDSLLENRIEDVLHELSNRVEAKSDSVISQHIPIAYFFLASRQMQDPV